MSQLRCDVCGRFVAYTAEDCHYSETKWLDEYGGLHEQEELECGRCWNDDHDGAWRTP